MIVGICTGTLSVAEKRLSSVYLAQACPFINVSMEARLSRAPGFLGGRIRHRLENMFASVWNVRDIGAVSRVLARRCAVCALSPPLSLCLHVLTWSAAKSRGKPDNANFGEQTIDNPPYFGPKCSAESFKILSSPSFLKDTICRSVPVGWSRVSP